MDQALEPRGRALIAASVAAETSAWPISSSIGSPSSSATQTAVDDFSLAVGKGEFISFLGPSGCGKTTTLQMIAGFLDPTRGAIRWRART